MMAVSCMNGYVFVCANWDLITHSHVRLGLRNVYVHFTRSQHLLGDPVELCIVPLEVLHSVGAIV